MKRYAGTFAWIFALVAAFVFVAVVPGCLTPGWKKGPGITLEFEVVDPKVDSAAVRKTVEARLKDQRAVVGDVGAGKISVWIPYSTAHQRARDELALALEAFRETQITADALERMMRMNGAERDKEIARLAADPGPRREALRAVAQAHDARTAAAGDLVREAADAVPVEVLQKMQQAKAVYDEAEDHFFQGELGAAALRGVLEGADDPADVAARKRRDELPVKYPAQAVVIKKMIAARDTWLATAVAGDLEPEDVERIVCAKGVVDFRIAVLPAEISGVQLEDAKRMLMEKGPNQVVDSGSSRAKWFKLSKAASGSLSFGYVTATSPDGDFILCYDEHDRTLTHADPKRDQWSLCAGPPFGAVAAGGLALPFSLDPKGAGYMGDLTGTWKGHPMAILFDDVVLSAPMIQSRINDAGQITFGHPSTGHSAAQIIKEAGELKEIMNAGSLPGLLRRTK